MSKNNIEAKRICVIPFEPLIDIKENKVLPYSSEYILKYNIENKYIFYPAQFWPHKNHIYIMKAIYILEKVHKIKLNIVFQEEIKVIKKR